MAKKAKIYKGRIAAFFLILVILAVVIGFTTKPIINNIKLGLDLQGGFEVLYNVTTIDGKKPNSETLHEAVAAINRRINALGVSEPQISIENGHQIRVQLAGIKDQAKARELLSTTAHLTFRDYKDRLMMDGTEIIPGSAKVEFDSTTNAPVVALKIKHPEKFAKITKEVLNISPPNNVLVIWLDWHKGLSYQNESTKDHPAYISAPQVHEVLDRKDIMITGLDSVEEAKNLAALLNAGALPVKMKEVYSTSVGAQLGQHAMTKTVTAGVIGIAAVFLFMLLFYRFGGFIANIALIAYIWLVLAVFVGLQAVLTLPGIAALILGVGMAVDANIITLERIKEEIRWGKSVRSAFKAGNHRSFTTIFDSNLTTIIAGAVMFVYGTSSVKGFAVMLIVSILASFLTAVFFARFLTWLWVSSRILDHRPGWFGVRKGDIREL
jgi:preprotein translocase subunit SecD